MLINIETKQLFEAIDALDVKKFKSLLNTKNVDVNFLKDGETPLTTLINYLSCAADKSEKAQEMIQALYKHQQLDIEAIKKIEELFPNEIKELKSDRTSTRQNEYDVNEARNVSTAMAAAMLEIPHRNVFRGFPSTVISNITIEPSQNRTYPI